MSKNQTLADKISSILSTTPAAFDPDENQEETSAKITEGAFEGDDETEEVLLSNFRKKNVEILGEIDVKYKGKRGSRKNFKDSDESENESIEASSHLSDDSDNDSVDFENENHEDKNEENLSNEEIEDEENERDEDKSNEDESDEYIENESDDENQSENEDNFRHIKEENLNSQLKKGLCVRNQLNIWENLLEMRIQMQKCLVAANKMPQKDYYSKLLDEGGDVLKKKVNETKTTLNKTLNKLLDLQSLLWNKYPDTKNLLKAKSKELSKVESDEEIPSDTEENESDHEIKPPKKRIKLLDFENTIDERHKNYKDYRNSTIQKWNDKTRVGSVKSDLQHSVLNQIDHILSDRNRLIKRTQTKRSNYEILGVKEEEDEKLPSEFNTEIFDDDDFYHQLLRELIEVKSADVTDPVQLGRQWIQLQNLRSKMKRKVDTRATKGRKIRYTVHTKLVNFMAPIDECGYTEEAKTELFSSLCGKNHVNK